MEAVGRLAVGIAHDFNNLLTAILGYGSIIRSSVAAEAEISADVDEVLKAAEKARRLTQQLLAFSRKQEIRPQSVDLNEVIRGFQGMLRRLVRENIEIRFELSETARPIVVDPVQMEQVILNLTVNACDAMPTGGTLTIATSSGCPDGAVCLVVSDTGCGIDESMRSRLFEPFFTTKESGKGTGLGLALVRDVVSSVMGTIDVESEPGVGTTFTLRFPASLEPVPAEADAPATACMPSSGETILLVEDDQPLRQMASRILRSAGYDVIEAANGEDALQRSADHPGYIDLLITDVIMPKLGGVELAGLLSEHRPDMRVIYMSGYSENTIKRQEKVALGSHWLGKPFSPHEFLSEVQNRLQTPHEILR